jgi:DNA repair exonuclease SbcCD ATPase subunit
MAHYDGHVEAAQEAYLRRLEKENCELKAEIRQLKAVISAMNKEGLTDAVMNAVIERDQLKAELAQVKSELSHARPRDLQPVTVFTSKGIWSAGLSEQATFVLEMNYRALQAQLVQATKREAQLREALERLYDVQNGCPLPKYEADWTEAMCLTKKILGYEDWGRGEAAR